MVDVGCGPGATLETIAASGHHGIGVDYSPALARAAAAPGAPTVVGDAERLPISDGAVDAVVIECVLSALPDKPAALDEARRVLRPDGALILTDMTLAAPFPEPLNTALAWVACAAGALSAAGYVDLLDAHGFTITATEDRTTDLAAMIARARRRLALFRGAAGVGLLPPLEEFIGPELTALAATVLGHTDLRRGRPPRPRPSRRRRDRRCDGIRRHHRHPPLNPPRRRSVLLRLRLAPPACLGTGLRR